MQNQPSPTVILPVFHEITYLCDRHLIYQIIMDIESLREYCLSLPLTTEDSAFGEGILLFRVGGRIFGCLSLDGDDYFALKCNPEYAIELRETREEIDGAYHWNKKYWNQLRLSGSLPDELIKSLIRHSYSEVVKKLTKRMRTEHPEITEIHGEA